MTRRALATIAVAAAALSAAAVPGAEGHVPGQLGGDHGLFLTVLPPGQGRSINVAESLEFQATGKVPAHFTDQLSIYNALATSTALVTDGNLTAWFKPGPLAVALQNVERTQTPRPGVTIVRDRFGVPHVHGHTRAHAMWGTGYVTAEDRLFFADVLRHVGRGRLSEFLGPSEANLRMDRESYLTSGYSEEELQRQVDRLSTFGATGRQVIADAMAFVDGINARIQEDLLDPAKLPAEYPALQLVPEPWRPTDVVAVASVIQARLASGGGAELANAVLLQALRARHGDEAGTALFDDLRQADDPEADLTIDAAFPSPGTGPVDTAAVALPDAGTVTPLDPLTVVPSAPSGDVAAPDETPSGVTGDPAGSIRNLGAALERGGLTRPTDMSNWLGVAGDRTATGHPVAVMGPQAGYWVPEVLMEMAIHAPGLHVRGATFPGASFYVLLGRGPDFAWSATSGGSYMVDVRAERLCEPGGHPPSVDARHYVFDGTCIPMHRRTDTWLAKPSAADAAPPAVVEAEVLRTVHGPVFAFGTVEGEPVAFTRQRATFLRELDTAVGFALVNGGAVTDASSFLHAFEAMTGSFNWLYVDHRDVAFYHSGLYPVRAPGVHPDLPSWGTGEWEWQGFVPAGEHPRAVSPAKGWMTSWNNKPAAGWRAADDQYAYGSVHRSEMLSSRLGPIVEAGGVTAADVVRVMADAATVDLRGEHVLPVVLEVLGDDPELRPYTDILRSWVESGAHRIDRDGDGEYEHEAAVALVDEWWPRLIEAVFAPALDGLFDLVPVPYDDPNRLSGVGSAFQSGYYGHVDKAVRMALGAPVASPYQFLRCADGTSDGCRTALSNSMAAAVAALGADPSAWDAREDRIEYTAVGLVSLPPQPWQNRPTWQQVAQPSSDHQG